MTTRTPTRSARLIDGTYLQLVIDRKPWCYWLRRLSHELGRHVRCYRLEHFAGQQKPGEPDHYDVVITPGWNGGCQCECKGYLAHRHCKHIESLLALHAEGKLS